MNRSLLLAFLVPVIFSCNSASSPKETAEKYLAALSAADLSTAASLTTTGTKAILDKAKKQSTNTAKPEESFRFVSLTETIASNNAEVKNEIVAIPMEKEEGQWKVKLSESLLNQIQDRDQLLAATKEKWDALLKEYDSRLQVIRQYIDYKKSMGALPQKVELLNQAMGKFGDQKEWTKETVLAYTEKQRQLNNLIDAALEPALSANTDLSLNYIVQVSTSNDRIKAAETAYQSAAEQAHSPVFVPLAFKQSMVVQQEKR